MLPEIVAFKQIPKGVGKWAMQLHEGGTLCVEGQQGQEPCGKNKLDVSEEQQKGQCDWSRGNTEWETRPNK